MKTPRLPHTDFANYAMLPLPLRERALFGHSTYIPPFTLSPFRKSLIEICNVQSGMFQFSPSPLDVVLKHVKKHCRKYPNSEEICLEVSEALWRHVQRAEIYCEERLIEPVAMGKGWAVQYWHDFYMVDRGKLVAPFFDGRKGESRLSIEGARFACSLSKHFLARGRFRDMQPRVYQFLPQKAGRKVSTIEFSDEDLLSIDEAETLVAETAELWKFVLERRAA